MEQYLLFGVSAYLSIQWASRGKQSQICADDSCHSLYYAKLNAGDSTGKGFPETKTISEDTIQFLTTVHPEYKRLDFDLYKGIVENMPIVCVDVLCQRGSDNRLLLFYRRDAPAAAIWWWPGGRIFRGETFYETARRKIVEETGAVYKSGDIEMVGVVNVWNTFFPDSNWDHSRSTEKYGTHTVNITVLCRLNDVVSNNENANNTNEGRVDAWAVEAQRWITVQDAIQVGKYDKYVRLNVENALEKGLLKL